MKKLNLICLLIILCFSITSCNHDIDENERVDKNEVSSITATALENSIMLSWTNPDDENFASTEIQFTPTVSTISQPIIRTLLILKAVRLILSHLLLKTRITNLIL